MRTLEPLACAAIALAALAAALVSQHVYGMQPCPWCVLQRLVFLVLAVVALLQSALLQVGLRHAVTPVDLGSAGRALNAAGSALRTLLAICGLAAALWQHFVAAESAACNLTWADRFLAASRLDALAPDVFQPRASCLEAKAWLLGIPYEFWSAALFLGLGLAAAHSAWRATRSAASAPAARGQD